MLNSPSQKARLAGALYLLCIACGFFAELVVRARLIDYQDAAVTASRITASPALYRLGFFADFAALTSGMIIAVLFYVLFKPVNRTLALLDFTLAIVSNVVSVVALILLFAPLMLLNGGLWRTTPPAQLQEFALFSIRLYELGYSINLMLFGAECLVTGYLIYQSQFLPKILGVLLAFGGMCYMVNSFVNFLPPHFADFLFPYVLLPCLLAETALAVWLTVFGVDNRRWHAIATPS